MPTQKKLLAGIIIFLALDFSILLINYWIAHQVSNDAIAINLAGRQRMLSQRITKSLVEFQLKKSTSDTESAVEELRTSARMFDQTLMAFKNGGQATGGDGKVVSLHRVKHGSAAEMMTQANRLWSPTRALLLPYIAGNNAIPDAVMAKAYLEMQQSNVALLNTMNDLTSSLQKDSLSKADTLRLLQTVVFFLALINFLVIVHRFHLLTAQAQKAKEYFSELAVRDHLTGLFNRREFEHNLKREISANSRLTKEKFAVVMVDLDHFKPINDQLGHTAGDLVLKTVAERIASHARITDTVARLGGDEFVLICTSVRNEENAAKFCERLLASINEPIALDDQQVQIGASIGVAFYPNRAKSETHLMQAADQAMYDAKKNGKNRFVCNMAH
ncbi:MAG TPA: diguanylate cyclase [Methylophilaceae bacterium]